MTEFLNRIVQHIHRVKTAPVLEWPAPLLMPLDQGHENVELIAFRRSNGRAPKLLDLGERGAVVFVGCGSGRRPDFCAKGARILLRKDWLRTAIGALLIRLGA